MLNYPSGSRLMAMARSLLNFPCKHKKLLSKKGGLWGFYHWELQLQSTRRNAKPISVLIDPNHKSQLWYIAQLNKEWRLTKCISNKNKCQWWRYGDMTYVTHIEGYYCNCLEVGSQLPINCYIILNLNMPILKWGSFNKATA